MPFLDKILPKLDRLDRDRVEGILKTIAGERDFLEKIFNLLSEGVVVTDAKGRISFANRAVELIIGASAGDIIGKDLREVARDPRLKIAVDEILRKRVGILSREITMENASKDHITVSAVPVEDASGQFSGVILMLRNTTTEMLRQLRYGQLRQMQTFGVMAAGIAHEIGNPLNSLDIHLQLIERRLKGVKIKGKADLLELITVAKEEIRRLEHIISQFLKAARPEVPEMKEADIIPLIDKTLSFMGPEIERHAITIEKQYTPFVPPLMLNTDGMRQVFINLIRNAIQVMPNGGVLRIGVAYARGHVLSSLSDSGPGIPEGQWEKIFEPYFTTREEGTGLGLMIVQRIVSEHGGEVLVSSSPGKGTTMTVKLPVPSKYGKLLTGRMPAARQAGEG